MNGYWNYIPLFRYLIPFIAGIIICLNFHFSQQWLNYLFYALVLAYAFLQLYNKTASKFNLQPFYGVLLHTILFIAGIVLVIHETPIYKSNYFMQSADSSSVFLCRITKPPELTDKNIRLYVNVEQQITSNKQIKTVGKSILYIVIDSTQKYSFVYGDLLLLKNVFTTPTPPKNPHAFNYVTYLQNQKIYHTAFVKSHEYLTTGANKSKPVWNFIFNTKANFIRSLEANLHDKNALAVAETLIIGQKSVLDEEVRQAYANTGTMHILAVSGLHVGILFIILEVLFKPFGFFQKKKSNAALIKTILILIIIWIYTCLSGLSASVNRSAVMFTFLAIGKTYERQTNTFNILFLSMLILLVDDPYQITQVGFQLSYMAVGGIVFFQPIITKLWYPKNYLLKQIWGMTSVSLAAQLATSPISFFYFHQFPNYFLLSNIVAIPVSFVVLVLGLAFFVVGTIPFIGIWVAFLLEWSLRIMNFAIIKIESLPFALTEGLYLETPETILCYIVLIYLGAFLVLKEKRYLLNMLLLSVLITGFIANRKITNDRQISTTFYSLKNQTAILFKNGEKAVLYSDTSRILETPEFKFQISADFVAQGIADPPVGRFDGPDTSFLEADLAFHFPYLVFGEMVIFVVTPENRLRLPLQADNVNYVLLHDNPFIKAEKLLETFPNAVFVADNTNSRKSNGYWKTQFEGLGVHFHSLRDDSALIVKH
ncbi:MAG: ComEC family competence protein [Bacteroidetes bacterium]|nr:ComEC family competence protein [Bacteroidota bacterium]